jgi:hypothetical protein
MSTDSICRRLAQEELARMMSTLRKRASSNAKDMNFQLLAAIRLSQELEEGVPDITGSLALRTP